MSLPVVMDSDDRILHILRFLSPEDVASVSCVSKLFKCIVKQVQPYYWEGLDLQVLFHRRGQRLNIIDKSIWVICVVKSLRDRRMAIGVPLFEKLMSAIGKPIPEGDFAEELGRRAYIAQLLPSISNDPTIGSKILEAVGLCFDDSLPPTKWEIFSVVRHMLTFPIEENGGVTLLNMPKGLTLWKLRNLFPNVFRHLSTDMARKYGNIAILKTHFIVITNGIFEGSRGKTTAEHRLCVQNKGCNMPGLLSAATHAVLKKEHFLSICPYWSKDVRTRCAEIVWDCHTSARCFIDDDLYLFNSSNDSNCTGVGGVRRVYTETRCSLESLLL